MLNETQINELKELLSKPKKIVITTHKSPDGDAMGSSLGLYNYLIKKKHLVKVITPNAHPDFLNWLAGNDNVIVGTEQPEYSEKSFKEADIIFCLDFNHLGRIDQLGAYVNNSAGIKIMIDHHLQPDSFPKYIYSDTSASSTCEMVFCLIEKLGDKAIIDDTIGYCLYTGIVTDTGSFRFAAATSKTLRIAADLMDAGVKNNVVHENIYDCNTPERMKLVGYATSEKFVTLEEYNTVYTCLTQAELDHFKYRSGDTEGIVNMGLSLQGVKLSAFFTERDGIIKISFRSKGDFDVNTFAREHFEGGGHRNAAGGMSNLTMDETVEKFTNLLPRYKAELIK